VTLSIDRLCSFEKSANASTAPISASSMSHVPVRIPDVALGAEELVAALGVEDQRRPPLDELPEGADRQRDARDEEGQPAARLKRRLAQQDLADGERREEAQREVADPIVVVAVKSERLARPVSERRLGVRVIAAVDQDQNVDEDAHVDDRRHRKPAKGNRQHRDSDQAGADLEQPVEPAFRSEDQREREDRQQHRQQRQRQSSSAGSEIHQGA
jgi:hypothetical protein